MLNPRFLFIFPLCLIAYGCGKDRVSPGISREKFTAYYAEEMFLTERSRLAGGDSLGLQRQLDSLREAFTITPGARDSLLAYYRDSLPRWESFLDDVARRLDERAGVRTPNPGAPGPVPETR